MPFSTWWRIHLSLASLPLSHSKFDLLFQASSPSNAVCSTDASAADSRIDELRAKIRCVEDKQFSVDYHDPEKRSIGNALLVTLNDGTVLDEVVVEYPVGHKRRVSIDS
jgi:2-methylcitrate dehydratase PrpD